MNVPREPRFYRHWVSGTCSVVIHKTANQCPLTSRFNRTLLPQFRFFFYLRLRFSILRAQLFWFKHPDVGGGFGVFIHYGFAVGSPVRVTHEVIEAGIVS